VGNDADSVELPGASSTSEIFDVLLTLMRRSETVILGLFFVCCFLCSMYMMNQRFNQQSDSINERFDSLNQRFNQQSDSTNQQFTSIKQRFDSIDAKLGDLHRETGIPARALAAATAVKVCISPCSSLGNCHASGILVKMSGNRSFVATCKHVLLATSATPNFTSACKRKIRSLTMISGQELNQTGDPLFPSHDDVDIALIPVAQIPDLEGVKVSETKVTPGATIYGVSNRENGVAYLQCQVIDRDPRATYRWQTNCGGTHGFSGTGYLATNGELVGLHKGQGRFLHFPETSDKGLDERGRTSEIDEDFSARKVQEKQFNDSCSAIPMSCRETLIQTVHLIARNPRSSLEDATYLNILEESPGQEQFDDCNNTS
jgi:hypothetical protein